MVIHSFICGHAGRFCLSAIADSADSIISACLASLNLGPGFLVSLGTWQGTVTLQLLSFKCSGPAISRVLVPNF